MVLVLVAKIPTAVPPVVVVAVYTEPFPEVAPIVLPVVVPIFAFPDVTLMPHQIPLAVEALLDV